MSEVILDHRYHLQEQIGVGGMAIVYRALDERTGHNVAIKVLREEFIHDEEFIKRFQREAEAASKVSHHNIVNLLDVGVDGDYRYLVMEYVQGKTLKQIIQEKGRLTTQQTLQITLRILSALQHAHEQGIIHRDIKPQNILMYDDGRVKVSDFGIARIANASTITQNDKVIGSVHYYSPEQAQGMVADVRSDIYSVGVTMYEMLTGHVPFDGDSSIAIAMQHIKAIPAPIQSFAPECPQAVVHVCMKAMEKNPANRYQTALDMASDLRTAMKNDTTSDESINMPVMREPVVTEDTQHTRHSRKAPASQHGPYGKRKTGKKKRNKLEIVIITVCIALVLGSLVFGSIKIYEKVVNSAEVPELYGLEVQEAQKIVSSKGIKAEIVEINHPTIPAGTVIMQIPEEGTALRKGDTVVLTVSIGPSSQKVPDVVGSTLNDAIAVAKSCGMTLTVVDRVVSGEIQADFIMSQVPSSGEDCNPGDIIQVVVSGGAAVIPNLEGMTISQAQNIITSAGLTLSNQITYVDTQDSSLHAKICEQVPKADSQVLSGTSVSIKVYCMQSMMHKANVKLDLPETDNLLNVRVALTQNGSSYEYNAFQGEFPANSSRHPDVELLSMEAGNYSCAVYINGEKKYSMSVVIQ